MNTLYVHTTPTDRQKGNYKFGQTIRTADGRIKEQARTAMSENPEKLWEGSSELSDFEVRKILGSMGYVHVIREWYGGFTSDDEVVAVMNKIISESSQDTRVEYSPRYFQTVIKNQFLTKYQSELDLGYNKIDFALELAPRFGKTIWL